MKAGKGENEQYKQSCEYCEHILSCGHYMGVCGKYWGWISHTLAVSCVDWEKREAKKPKRYCMIAADGVCIHPLTQCNKCQKEPDKIVVQVGEENG